MPQVDLIAPLRGAKLDDGVLSKGAALRACPWLFQFAPSALF